MVVNDIFHSRQRMDNNIVKCTPIAHQTRAVLSQGNRAMQRDFSYTQWLFECCCFRLRKAKAVKSRPPTTAIFLQKGRLNVKLKISN